jgi:hypothetical protein
VSSLGFAGMEIQPLGGFYVEYKETGDRFVIQKCKTVAKNLIMGTTYVWQTGEMTCKNLRTGDIATLDFLDKGWTSTDDFKCHGVIKDSKGKVCYTLEGLWDRHLKATSTATGKTTI